MKVRRGERLSLRQPVRVVAAARRRVGWIERRALSGLARATNRMGLRSTLGVRDLVVNSHAEVSLVLTGPTAVRLRLSGLSLHDTARPANEPLNVPAIASSIDSVTRVIATLPAERLPVGGPWTLSVATDAAVVPVFAADPRAIRHRGGTSTARAPISVRSDRFGRIVLVARPLGPKPAPHVVAASLSAIDVYWWSTYRDGSTAELRIVRRGTGEIREFRASADHDGAWHARLDVTDFLPDGSGRWEVEVSGDDDGWTRLCLPEGAYPMRRPSLTYGPVRGRAPGLQALQMEAYYTSDGDLALHVWAINGHRA